MLAPFFMKMHGYSMALAGIPLVANGIGRVFSDLLSGIMATYFSAGALLIAATVIALATQRYWVPFSRHHAGIRRRLDYLRTD